MTTLTEYTKAYNIGPGCWFGIHLLSYYISLGKLGRDNIKKLTNHIKTHFPCLECRGHFTKMINENPINEITTDGIFHHFFILHKMVNDRLGKETPLFKYVEQYFESTVKHEEFVEHDMLLKFKDVKYVGIGLWWMLHSTAQHEKELFEVLWKMLQRDIPHLESRREMEEYNRVNSYASFGRINYAKYMWSFHDHINNKLGKTSESLTLVIKFFEDSESCKADCTSEHNSSSGNKRGRFIGF